MITLQEFADWMKYSISAHNSQPFQIAQAGEVFQIWVDPKRLLPVADPQHKDLFTSLGALYETLSVFSSAKNFKLIILNKLTEIDNETAKNRPVLEFKLESSKQTGFVNLNLYEKRFSYRGVFPKRHQAERQRISTENAFTLEDDNKIRAIAELFDHVNYEALSSDGYIEELYAWLRFNSKHESWSKDGLNSEAMALKGIENWGASKVLKPKVFKILHKLGLAKPLVREADKINSALGLWVIWAPKSADAFECGRIFQREWVALTAHSLFGAPLSVLTDREDKSELLKNVLGLNQDQKLVNILRVGFLGPQYFRYQPSRKSAEDNIRKL